MLGPSLAQLCKAPPCHTLITHPNHTHPSHTLTVPGRELGEKEDSLAEIAAKQYYVEYGPDMDTDRLTRLIPT